MKDQKTKEKFVELRAEGLSFDKIAQRINVSKPTLLTWNKELNTRIEELKSIRYEEILEKFKATKEKKRKTKKGLSIFASKYLANIRNISE